MTPEIRLTGTAAIVGRDGVTRVPPTADSRTALARLVLGDPDSTTRAALADVLWPRLRPVTWEPQVRKIVGRVRTLLRVSMPGINAIAWADGRYVVELPDDVMIDIRHGERSLSLARAAADAGDHLAAYDHATSAARSFDGGFLPESVSEWAATERKRCERLLARAHDTATVAARELGDPAKVLVLTGTAVQREPTHPA